MSFSYSLLTAFFPLYVDTFVVDYAIQVSFTFKIFTEILTPFCNSQIIIGIKYSSFIGFVWYFIIYQIDPFIILFIVPTAVLINLIRDVSLDDSKSFPISYWGIILPLISFNPTIFPLIVVCIL